MKTLITFTLFIFCTQICAQKYPVHVNTQLSAPYSPYLSDYTTPGSQNFAAHIFANDISLSDYPCKLRLSIEGPGITLRTNANFLPRPIYIQGGVPLTLYGDDLHEYFHPDNLDLSGLPEYRYEKTQKLPEGIYRFTVEVLDYNRGTVVSNKGTTMAWIMLNDPPILQFPSNYSTLRIQDPVNILFSWTARHNGSPNAAFATEYTFRLIELWTDRNPNDAFLTQAPLFQVTTSRNQVHFGPSEPQLIAGRKYAWQVQAQEPGGRSLFKNNGRSEVYVFQFGEALAIPANLRMRWAKPTTLAIQWDAVKRDDGEIRYRLQYRPRLRRENHEWYETWTRFTEKTLYNLQSNTEYEMRIRSENALQESEYSEIREFKTLREEIETFVCRDVPPPPEPDNTIPVFPLSVNDTIHAGGYNIIVRDVIKVGSKYYGSGMAIVPWFNGAKVRVTFENIAVNDQFWLTSGTINSVWNSESTFLLEEQTPIAPGAIPEAGELDITVVKTDSMITITEAVVVSVSRSDVGDIVVATSDGEEKTLPKGESYAIVDQAGNGYVVDEQGNIAKTTSAEASATATRGNKKYNLAMSFFPGEGGFGFDEKRFDGLASYYQQMDDGTYVPWKALSSSRPDVIGGKLNDGDISIDQITFEAGSSPIVPVTRGGSDATLQLHGRVAGMEEELLALYRRADSIPPTVVGKVNLVTYNPINYNLAIVPVNGATLPGGLDARLIADDLNKVYRQAVVEWNVTVLPGIQVPLQQTFDEGETGLLSNYTDDMKKVLRAFGPLRDNTYYIFLVAEPRNQSTLGYMPRNRQAGFVFTGPHHGNATEFVKTLAHELGHGAFNLQHTFKEHNIPAGATDNVMDYSNGTALYKYQWDHIHQPQSVIGLFEGGEEGAMNFELVQIETQFLNRLGAESTASNCWTEGVSRAYELRNRFEDETAVYAGLLKFFLCETEIENCGKSNKLSPFTCGLTNALLQELDWIAMLESIEGWSVDPEEILKCMITSFPIGSRLDDQSGLESVIFKCLTGIDMDDLEDALKEFVAENWDEPYYQGQATGFAITLLSPFKDQVVAKIGKLSRYVGKMENFKLLAKAGSKDELAGIARLSARLVDDDQLQTIRNSIKFSPSTQLPTKVASTFTNKVYKNRKLINSERFFKYHGTNNKIKKDYTWVTNKKYQTEKELRGKVGDKGRVGHRNDISLRIRGASRDLDK